MKLEQGRLPFRRCQEAARSKGLAEAMLAFSAIRIVANPLSLASPGAASILAGKLVIRNFMHNPGIC